MNALLWMLQGLLAAAFLAHGLMFLFPSPELALLMDASIARPLRYGLGVAEVAAAVGLMVPGLTRIQPWLVSAAAAGLIPIMIGATVLHAYRRETGPAAATAVLLVMACAVAGLRWRVHAIRGR